MALTKINQHTRNRRDCSRGVVQTRPLDAISRRQSGSIQGSYGMLSCQNKPYVGQTSKHLSSICSPGTSVVWRRPSLSILSQHNNICSCNGAYSFLHVVSDIHLSVSLAIHLSDCSVVLHAHCRFSGKVHIMKFLWHILFDILRDRMRARAGTIWCWRKW